MGRESDSTKNKTQYQPALLLEPPSSPSFDSLSHDLDTFINEFNCTLFDTTLTTPSEQHSSSLMNIGSGPPLSFQQDAGPSIAQQHVSGGTDTISPPASPSLFPRVPEMVVPHLEQTSSSSSEPTFTPSTPSPPQVAINNDSSDDSDDAYSTSAAIATTTTFATPKINTAKPMSTSSSSSTTVPLTTRTSSLERQPSNRPPRLASLQQQQQQQHQQHQHSHGPQQSPAIMSHIAQDFVDRVKQLNKTRRIFCTEEYPMSFTGEEAVKIMRDLLPSDLRPILYRKVARALMHISPPLISPVSYSEKSMRKNTLYDSPYEVYTIVEETMEVGYAQGVYTAISPCYTYGCNPATGGCYAPMCPNRSARKSPSLSDKHSHLRRNMSMTSSSLASSHDTTLSRAWQATVSRDILQNTPEQEIKRQEAIHELIYTEEDYVRDLNLLDDLFAKSLRSAQCIDEKRRGPFCDNVFNNYIDILNIHKDLYRDLRDHQSMCQAKSAGGFVDQVGDIFLRHLPRFMAAYTQYGPHVVLAEYAVKREAGSNILFQNFIREKERQAECRKLPFRHFIVLPVTRLQRYPLLIDAVLKRTQDDHPDKDDLAQCLDVLREIGAHVDELASAKRMTMHIYEINDNLKFKPGDPVYDLQLAAPGRKLLHEGTLTRRTHMGVEAVEHHFFLFDHLLLITKRKGNNDYVLWRKPIPLELLHMRDGTEGFSLGMRTLTNTSTFPPTPGSLPQQHMMSPATSLTMSPTNLSPATTMTPITPPSSSSTSLIIQHLGRHGDDYLFYAPSAQQRMEWKQKIVEAKEALEMAFPERRAFDIRSLSDTTFALTGGPANHGKVTCSTAFVGARGIRMVAIGTETGVWMGIEGDTNNLRKVLPTDYVTQIGVLEEYHVFLVLSDKMLMAYPLDALDPTALNKPAERASFKVASHVSFFNTGVCNNRTLVIVMKKKGLDSLFRTYDPVCGDLRDPRNSKFLTTKTSFLSKAPAWFKLYREFYIGAEATSVQFLKARLAVVCSRGFEIIDLNRLNMIHNLPELQDPDFSFVQQRYDNLVPLGMFRCRDHYLLCYNEFAFMVDMHGKYKYGNYQRIDWEGSPESVAFSYPYVIAFDSRFIEVRHVETGQLVQVLAGEHMQCLQYKQNAITPPVVHGSMAHPFKHGYQYVFHLAGVFEPSLIWQ